MDSGQVGGSCHDAEIHFVHENPETSEILVVGIFLDIREYGSNVVVSIPRHLQLLRVHHVFSLLGERRQLRTL